MAVLVAGVPAAETLAGVCTAVVAVAAVAVGVRSYRPRGAWIWLVLAVGISCTAFPKMLTGGATPQAVMIFVVLIGNLAFLVAPLSLVRMRGGKDREEAFDGWILALALAVGLRQLLLAGQPDRAVVPQQVVLVLTVTASVTLAASLRLLFLARRSPSAWLLLLGSVAGQFIGISLAMTNSGIIDSVVGADILAGLSRLLLGAAALAPGMTALTVPVERRGDLPYARVVLLGVALSLAIAGVFVEVGGDRLMSLGGLGVLGIVVLLIVRVAQLINDRERARRLHALVAELGTRALSEDDEHRLVRHIVEQVRAAMSADVVALLYRSELGVAQVAAADGGPLPPLEELFADGVADSRSREVRTRSAATLAVPLTEGGVLMVRRCGRRATFSVDERVSADAVGVTVSSALRRCRSEAQARYAAMHDALTGLPNRAQFLARLDSAVTDMAGDPVALLLLDLNRFKDVNDNLGHRAGDELLVAAADRMRGVVPADGLLARLAGDEFVVLLQGVAAACHAADVAKRLGAALDEPFVLTVGVAQISGSVGVAVHRAGESMEQLLHRADVAMYQRKRERSRR
ncbi:GGDEF domain-containing protein [Dactylosporangium aurantiacum]|uniref:GGDEF domain-containing protein n=1 Tax=Dactylosporangium aurantiacum TaxID=35754 RepID=A0A9Q9MN28_9ACTN|nr:GGDEF domain-containing protein [Dactylosporangium aurantiacum]MDG6103998.1 GGDEF domain-containing protein [Dactylosporangium aurantiacum]UWZ58826.1 GGDEF domain-containing protein [Dactylosporangium aurantiacum]